MFTSAKHIYAPAGAVLALAPLTNQDQSITVGAPDGHLDYRFIRFISSLSEARMHLITGKTSRYGKDSAHDQQHLDYSLNENLLDSHLNSLTE